MAEPGHSCWRPPVDQGCCGHRVSSRHSMKGPLAAFFSTILPTRNLQKGELWADKLENKSLPHTAREHWERPPLLQATASLYLESREILGRHSPGVLGPLSAVEL